MVESLKVQGPIEVKDNSAERVAYDLMLVIANNENPSYNENCRAKKDSARLYYLNLYVECINAIKHYEVPKTDISQK